MSKLITISTYDEEVTYELASFVERLAARIIDVLIIIIPNTILPLVAGWLYWALQQGGKPQATVGQKALGIKVVDLNGNKVEFPQATGRFFANILNVLTIFLGYFMFFLNDKNQCLHDYLSNVVVVKENEIERKDDISRHLV